MSDSLRADVSEAVRQADELEDGGDLAGAVAVLSREIQKVPLVPKLYALRGRLHHLMKAYEDAIRDFDTALSLRPTAASTFYSRARAKSFINDLDGALEDFEECVKLQPQSADAFYEMGMINEYRKNLKEALRFYEEAKRISAETRPDFQPPDDLDDRIASVRQRVRSG